MELPCMNQNNGCTVNMLDNDIVDHEIVCRFGERKCPFELSDRDCDWVGLLSNLGTHCLEHHPNNVTRYHKKKLSCSDFKPGGIFKVNELFHIFLAYNEYFLLAWDVDFEAEKMKWCVFNLSETLRRKSFKYRILFVDQDCRNRYVKFGSKCPLMKDYDNVFNNSPTFTSNIHTGMVLRFCKNDRFFYTVQITKDNN